MPGYDDLLAAVATPTPAPTGGQYNDLIEAAQTGRGHYSDLLDAVTPSATPASDAVVAATDQIVGGPQVFSPAEEKAAVMNAPQWAQSAAAQVVPRAKAFVQGIGVPTSLQEAKDFLLRSPVQDVRDIAAGIAEIPGKVANIGQTLATSPAATVVRAPLSPEAFGVYGTAAGMLAPGLLEKAKGARPVEAPPTPEAPPEAAPPVAVPEGYARVEPAAPPPETPAAAAPNLEQAVRSGGTNIPRYVELTDGSVHQVGGFQPVTPEGDIGLADRNTVAKETIARVLDENRNPIFEATPAAAEQPPTVAEPAPPAAAAAPRTVTLEERTLPEGDIGGTVGVEIKTPEGVPIGDIGGKVTPEGFTVNVATIDKPFRGKGNYQAAIRQMAEKYGTVRSSVDLKPEAEGAWQKVGAEKQPDGSYVLKSEAPPRVAEPPLGGDVTVEKQPETFTPAGAKTKGETYLLKQYDQTVGALEAYETPDGLQVGNINVADNLRRRGLATQLYEKLLDDRGAFVSDNSVSQKAASVYPKLAERGHTVTKNPTAYLDPKSEMWRTKDGKPVYEVTKGVAEPPLGGAREGAKSYPGFKPAVQVVDTGEVITAKGQEGHQALRNRVEGQVRAGYTDENGKFYNLMDVVRAHMKEAPPLDVSFKSVGGAEPPQGGEPPAPPQEPAPPPPAEPAPQPVGISQARTEAELGAGSVEPGVGAEMGTGLNYGRNYINKGGDPRLPIRRAQTTGLVGKNEVGIVHAELERLRGERDVAARAAEANPNDPVAQEALAKADNAQRAWRKELQPVLTKASDALREAYAESTTPDVGTYAGLSNLMDEHFNGKHEITPADRTTLQKVAKAVTDARTETAASVDRAVEATAKRAKKVMTPQELRNDLASVLTEAFKDCFL